MLENGERARELTEYCIMTLFATRTPKHIEAFIV